MGKYFKEIVVDYLVLSLSYLATCEPEELVIFLVYLHHPHYYLILVHNINTNCVVTCNLPSLSSSSLSDESDDFDLQTTNSNPFSRHHCKVCGSVDSSFAVIPTRRQTAGGSVHSRFCHTFWTLSR